MAIQPVEQGSAFAFRNVINNNFYELKVLSGASKPTQSTAAVVGQMYLDTSEGKMYFCSNVSGSVYTWKPFASDMSASNVSYDNGSSGMSSDNVQDAIDELFTSASNGKELIADAIAGKGVPTSADDTYATMAGNIEKIETGIDISDATLTSASELKKNIVAYSKTGKRIVGSLGQGTVNKPNISVNSEGKITASTSYTSGIIGSSTVSNTSQLSTQSGTTITPGTSQKTAVATGKYTTGPVYVAGDSDLVPSNIKNGVNIFGVNGSYTGEDWFNFIVDPQDTEYFSIYRNTMTLDLSFGGYTINKSNIKLIVGSFAEKTIDSDNLLYSFFLYNPNNPSAGNSYGYISDTNDSSFTMYFTDCTVSSNIITLVANEYINQYVGGNSVNYGQICIFTDRSFM